MFLGMMSLEALNIFLIIGPGLLEFREFNILKMILSSEIWTLSPNL